MVDTPTGADRSWEEFCSGVGLGFGAALLIAPPLGLLSGVLLPFEGPSR